MMRIRINSLLAVLLVLAGGQAGLRAQTKAEDAQAPDFKEVYDLIRAHLAGMSEAQLNRAAVGALVSGLAPRVSLVTNAAAASAAAEDAAGDQVERVRGGHPLRAGGAGRRGAGKRDQRGVQQAGDDEQVEGGGAGFALRRGR